LVAKTDISSLDYPVNEIVVRGFDGENPPPRLIEPERPLFYGYGITAYYQSQDTLVFFKVQQLEIVHLNTEGEIIHTFNQNGSRYTESFKGYFIHLSPEEKRLIYIRNIYLKDKKGKHLLIKDRLPWCPHC